MYCICFHTYMHIYIRTCIYTLHTYMHAFSPAAESDSGRVSINRPADKLTARDAQVPKVYDQLD